MLTITIKVNAPPDSAMGIKEDLATYLERFGDAQVVAVEDSGAEQLQLNDYRKGAHT